MASSFSIVIPTYRRGPSLRRVLPSYTATDAEEVIVVDDGSGPEHAAILAEVALRPRVRLVALPEHLGLPAARNAGAAESRSDWVVYGEDDVWFTPDYPRTLVDHAEAGGALVASGSGPLVHPDLLEGDRATLERAIRDRAMEGHPGDRLLRVPWPVERLPSGDMMTPLLTAWAAVHRSVFDRVRYDPGFRGNAFREETDFFLSCWEAGIHTLRCVHARCGHMKAHGRALGGGSWSMSKPRYVWQMVGNNWRLLRKHETLIRSTGAASGRPAGPVRMQGEFVISLLGRIRPRRA